MTRKTPDTFAAQRWFGASDLRSFGHRSRTLQMGYGYEDFMGKPVIGIINTWSDINPCHTHLRDARRGGEARRLAGGRLPGRAAGDVALREPREADDHALPQPAGDGDRGAAALPPDRRRGAARRLRQDHARPADGRASA